MPNLIQLTLALTGNLKQSAVKWPNFFYVSTSEEEESRRLSGQFKYKMPRYMSYIDVSRIQVTEAAEDQLRKISGQASQFLSHRSCRSQQLVS